MTTEFPDTMPRPLDAAPRWTGKTVLEGVNGEMEANNLLALSQHNRRSAWRKHAKGQGALKIKLRGTEQALVWDPVFEALVEGEVLQSLYDRPSFISRGGRDVEYYHRQDQIHRVGGAAVIYDEPYISRNVGVLRGFRINGQVGEFWTHGVWQSTHIRFNKFSRGRENTRRVIPDLDPDVRISAAMREKINEFLDTVTLDWTSERLFVDPVDEFVFLNDF